MELRQIQYFLEVAKREHVTDAANSMHVAQSAVSRQIANLEAELGVELFHREGRNVKLTNVGRLFRDHVKIAMNEIDTAVQKVTEHLDPERGMIRIGFSTSLSVQTLPNVISSFRFEHPEIEFQLHQGSLKYLMNMIERGDIDLAFVAPVPSEDEYIAGTIFYTENLLALVPTDNPLANQDRIRLNQLRNERFVSFRPGYSLQPIIISACKDAGFTPYLAFEGEDIETIKGLVSAGLGVAILPESSLQSDIPLDTKSLIITEPTVTRSVGIILPKTRQLAPSEQIFLEYVQNFYDRLNRFGR